MNFPQSLQRGILIKRYKRFLADVSLASGEVITAHVANPGAMTGLAEPGSEVWLSRSANQARKLPWSWELVRVGSTLVSVNTQHPNALVAEALDKGALPAFTGYETIRSEVPYDGNSRVDFLLTGAGRRDCFVEVKAVSLRQGYSAAFPDSVTARGSKHLRALGDRVRAGDRAVMLFIVQRADCLSFRVADEIDPAYGRILRCAMAEGVETLCYACRLSVDGIEIGATLPIILDMGV